MRYLIQFKGEIEVDVENPDKAKEEGAKKFPDIEKAGCKVSEAKVVDQKSGYFV